MSKLEPAGSVARIAETAETLTWLTDWFRQDRTGTAAVTQGWPMRSISRVLTWSDLPSTGHWVPVIWRPPTQRQGES